MARPTKCRKVCRLPENNGFVPIKCKGEPCENVCITVDEYETIRLIDSENFSQEKCGEYMKVARTTVQQIYTSARKKIAHAMVCGLTIRIEGGDYSLCDGSEPFCACGGCEKHRFKG